MFRRQAIPSVRPADVGPDAYLLDVREPDEWAAGHAPDAHHIPMMEIPGRVAEVPADRDVVVICRVGGRSGQVVSYLHQLGRTNVRNLDGGMQDWAATGRELVSEDGRAPRVV